MRHVVNFGLLFSFLTLAVTGALAFWRPFSLVTTRVHIVFGAVTLVLVGLHLATRVGYFRKQITRPSSKAVPRPLLIAMVVAWLLLLRLSLTDKAPASTLVAQSYESRQRSAIVRASSLVGLAQPNRSEMLLSRSPGKEANVAVSIAIRFREELPNLPALAVWAESTSGSMIETLHLSPELAYSEDPDWAGQTTPRHHILPLWRHRHTLVTGIDPEGNIDAMTGATQSHSFTLDRYLQLGEESSFVLCVEVNAANDPNNTYKDPHLGQPSLLYTALVELDAEQRYTLLELTGHGGGAEENGAIQYDLEAFDSAKQLIDLVLAHHLPTEESLED